MCAVTSEAPQSLDQEAHRNWQFKDRVAVPPQARRSGQDDAFSPTPGSASFSDQQPCGFPPPGLLPPAGGFLPEKRKQAMCGESCPSLPFACCAFPSAKITYAGNFPGHLYSRLCVNCLVSSFPIYLQTEGQGHLATQQYSCPNRRKRERKLEPQNR
jgi:hypothetical protein